MKRALPYSLFAAVTLAVFWKFLFLGHTLLAVALLEEQLGLPVQEPRGWFASDRSRARVADNLLLLSNHLRIYNEGLHHGELRLWNPTLCCGLPLYSDPMTHPFYPPQLLLHALLPPEPAYEIFLMLHLFFSGASMFLLLRALGRSAGAATAGGVIWMLLGYSSMWFTTGILAGVSGWGPLVLLLLYRALETGDLSRSALAGVAMGLAILGSHPQHALHFFLFTIGWGAVLGARTGGDLRRAARVGTVYVLLSLGVGLAAVLTRLDTIANGFRNPGADLAFLYADGTRLLGHLLDPVLDKVTSYENPSHYYEFALHAGLAAVTLAIVGAIRHAREGLVRFLAVSGALTLGFAFLKPLAYGLSLIPILNLSLPSRWLFIFGLPLAILASYGWDALADRPGRTPTVLGGIAGAGLVAVAVGMRFPGAIDTLMGFLLAAGAALCLGRSRKAAGVLALVALLYELLPSFLVENWHFDPSALRHRPAAVEAARSGEREPWRGTGALGSPTGSSLPLQARSAVQTTSAILQDLSDGNNLLALFGVDNVAGFEAIMPEAYVKYVLAAGGQLAPGGRATLFLRFRSRLVDGMNLRYAFLPPGLQAPSHFRRVPGEFGSIVLYENPRALPRAWLAPQPVVVPDEKEALQRLSLPDFDPRTTVVLEGEGEAPAAGSGVPGTVTFTRRESDCLELQVSAATAAVLVLAENDYPGWEAQVDSTPVPLRRANVAFRAVAVPPGDHRVSLRFRPEPARTGALGSAFFLALGLGFATVRRFRRAPG